METTINTYKGRYEYVYVPEDALFYATDLQTDETVKVWHEPFGYLLNTTEKYYATFQEAIADHERVMNDYQKWDSYGLGWDNHLGIIG